MRTITTITHVYTIDELTGVNKQNALEAVARQRTEDFMEFHSEELRKSMQKAAERFNVELSDWSFGLFNRSYVTVDMTGFPTDEEEIKELVTWLNDHVDDGTNGDCPFTGVCYDSYFFDYFAHAGFATPDTVRNDIPRAITYMLRNALNDEENSILNDKDNEQYAIETELEFREDGTIFNG